MHVLLGTATQRVPKTLCRRTSVFPPFQPEPRNVYVKGASLASCQAFAFLKKQDGLLLGDRKLEPTLNQELAGSCGAAEECMQSHHPWIRQSDSASWGCLGTVFDVIGRADRVRLNASKHI